MAKRPICADKEKVKEICAAIAAGMPNLVAIEGIMAKTAYYNSLNKGEEDIENGKDTVYSEFYLAIKKAEKGFRLAHLKKIRNASEEGNWQASAWMLERRYPEEYGRNRLEITGKDGGAVEADVKSMVQIYLPDNGR